MSRRRFRVLKSLGGCGGTIVSRALAAQGAVVLSEVNPRAAQLFAGALNPLVQVCRQHPELLPAGWRDADLHTLGKPEVFGQFLTDVGDLSERPLLIRDYSYIDYVGVPFIWPQPDAASLEPALAPFGAVAPALLVRRPDASLRSLLRHPPLATTLAPADFIHGYRRFLEDNAGAPVFRFEDFLADPDPWLRALCQALELPYATGWREALGGAPALTGNARAMASLALGAAGEAAAAPPAFAGPLADAHGEVLRLCGYDA